MANQIRTKDELLALFADNTTGLITPQDMRDFVVSNLVAEGQIETTPGQTMSAFTDVFLADVGASSMILPTIADFGSRFLSVINASGGSLQVDAAGGETIDGNAFTTLDDEQYLSLAAKEGSTDWITLINTSEPDVAPNDYALGTITDSVAITNIIGGTYVDVNDAMLEAQVSPDFTVSASQITFNGPSPKLFAIDVALTAGKTMGSIESYTVALILNTILNGPTMGISFSNGVADNVGLHNIQQLSDGDDVKIQIRGDTTSDDLIVTDLILRLTEIKQ